MNWGRIFEVCEIVERDHGFRLAVQTVSITMMVDDGYEAYMAEPDAWRFTAYFEAEGMPGRSTTHITEEFLEHAAPSVEHVAAYIGAKIHRNITQELQAKRVYRYTPTNPDQVQKRDELREPMLGGSPRERTVRHEHLRVGGVQ